MSSARRLRISFLARFSSWLGSWAQHDRRRPTDSYDQDQSKKLFDPESAVGSFGARIELGYALALFGEKTNHDLRLIKLIRNGFAHCQRPIHFEIPEVAAVCTSLQIPDTDQATSPRTYLVGVAEATETEHWQDKDHPKNTVRDVLSFDRSWIA